MTDTGTILIAALICAVILGLCCIVPDHDGGPA